MPISKLYAIFILFSLYSCEDPKGNKLNTRSIRDQMEDRKIHRVKPADIINETAKRGKKITGLVSTEFIKNLKVHIEGKPFNESINYCNINLKVTDSLKGAYSADIKRIPLRGMAKLKLNNKELEMWDAYRYNIEKKIQAKENSQRLGDNTMLYTSGIIIDDQLCLKCHGNIEKDIKVESFKILKARFPQFDSLVNYKRNDLIGIWSVLLDKRKIIKSIK